MFEFHTNKEVYYRWQYENARDYVIPFIEGAWPIQAGMQVLEVGCGEGGVLRAFIERGCTGLGVELDDSRVIIAEQVNKEWIDQGKMRFISKDIYDPTFVSEFRNQFDIIVLKDVIEHIHDQPKIMAQLKTYLKEGGKIFFGFPPWYMPFGGHQQLCVSRVISKVPYYHLLPMPLYKMVLKLFGENQNTIDVLVETKETGISISRFERICSQLGYKIDRRHIYFFNPIYKYKFNLAPRLQWSVLSAIPYLRDLTCTCTYYLIG
jgi:SAM-dependent methyltransferase